MEEGMNWNETALVLEGGGMRGVFTCGVLDYMLDAGITFPYGIGVSAGACNGLSFFSRQRERAKKTNIDMLEKYRYIGLRYWRKQRSLLDLDFLYRRLPTELLPYDYDTFFSSGARYEIVLTDCETGKARYAEEYADPDRLLLLAKASSNLPYICPVCDVDGRPTLDGGIVDSIPVQRALEQGYERCLVVLTREQGYRKKGKGLNVPFFYGQFPELREALAYRSLTYNAQLELVERLEAEGKIYVIRPQSPVAVGRMETNTDKLRALYAEGYRCAEQFFASLPTTSSLQKA